MRNLTWIVCFLLFSLFGPVEGHADSRSVYYDSLKVAQAKLDRQATLRTRSNLASGALSTTLLGQFLGRRYKVGESWKVAAWIPDPSIMRQTMEANAMQPKRGRGGLFRYEVTGVRGNEVNLEITQLDAPGFPIVDPHVKSLNLTISLASGFEQTAKKYVLTDNSKIFSASSQGLHVPMSHLELFPLEAPELTTAIRSPVRTEPLLPPSLQSVTGGTSLAVNPARATHFEQDDFFGRQVEVIWRQGDPWPAYVKTTNGTAILVSASGGAQ